MNRREFARMATTALAGIFCGTAVEGTGNTPKCARPNVLFVMTDQQHSGMMSCTGNKWVETPAMDSLAREGIRFERAYCANPVCVPSRTSMATGVMPGRLGVFGNKKAKIPEKFVDNSMGVIMKRAGYDTFYGGKVHMYGKLDPRKAGYDQYFSDQRDKLPEACVRFMTKKRDKPFLAVASFINPHDICYAYLASRGKNKPNMASVDRLYRQASSLPTDQLPPLPENYAIPPMESDAVKARLSTTAVTPSLTMRKTFSERDWRIYRWIYCRLTEQVDQQIGRILKGLKDAGLTGKTLVVFTSDHGNMDASHRLSSKGLFYDESVRVPLIIKTPGVTCGGRVDWDHLVSTGLDILPTLCDYAETKAPEHFLGKSLRQIIEGKPVTAWRSYVAAENSWGRMIRSQRFKYCAYDSGATRESLVDMEDDSGEMQNLCDSEKYKVVLDEHRRYLKGWVKLSGDKAGLKFI